jgi:hypothetical protein
VARHVLVAGDPAADADAIGVRVALTQDDAVLHRVVRVDLPAEELRVVAMQRRAVGADDLEVHDRLSHGDLPLTPVAPSHD